MEIISLISTTLTFFSIYFLLSLSLNLEYGYTGLPNFGKVFFFSLGAYTSAIIASRVLPLIAGIYVNYPFYSAEASTLRIEVAKNNPLIALLTFVLSLIMSVVVGATIGYLISSVLKLREDYFAIGLIIISELSRVFIRTETSIVGGTQGLGGIPNPFLWINDVHLMEISYTLLTLVIAVFVYLYVEKLVNSPYGRVLKAIRDDELATRVLGKKVSLVKSQVMAVGSAISAIAGCIYAYFIGFIYPDDFIIIWTMYAWLIILLGGVANNKGAFIGSLILLALDRSLRFVASSLLLSGLAFDINYLRGVIISVTLIVILMFRPRGILQESYIKTPALSVVSEWISKKAKVSR